MKQVDKPFQIPLFICGFILLLAAVGHFPYDFYVLLRLAVFFTCAIESMAFYGRGRHILSGAFAFVALLYNPFLPLHLHRSTWVAINWATLLFFVAMVFQLKSPTHQPKA